MLGREQVEVDLEAIGARTSATAPCSSPAPAARSARSSAASSRGSARARLVLVEQGESALYEMRARARRRARTSRPSIPVLADCGDLPKMREVFERYRPEVVFHAAAYKHVPMLETNPLQAVTNNVLATRDDRRRSRSSSASSASC